MTRCIDCWEPAVRLAKLPDGTDYIGPLVALCAACHDKRLSADAGAHILSGGRAAWVAGRRPERDVCAADLHPGQEVTVGPTDYQIRKERRTARCPCHNTAHQRCPAAHPCIGRCGRMTTAHEAPACGYCARCSASNRGVPLALVLELLGARPAQSTHAAGGAA